LPRYYELVTERARNFIKKVKLFTELEKIVIMLNEKEIKDWYDRKHRILGENAWRPYEAYPIFLDYLNVTSGKTLLDIGCGTGYLLKAADQRGLETYGVDISDEAVKITKKNSPNSKIIVGKGEELEFPPLFFDYVTCIGALEHFLDMELSIKEMLRVAKKGALFCIVVPNINFFVWKIGGIKGTEQKDINEKLLSLKDWKNILLKEEFEILKIYQDKYIFKANNIFQSLNPLAIVKRTICKSMYYFLPLKYAYQFIFIMEKVK